MEHESTAIWSNATEAPLQAHLILRSCRIKCLLNSSLFNFGLCHFLTQCLPNSYADWSACLSGESLMFLERGKTEKKVKPPLQEKALWKEENLTWHSPKLMWLNVYASGKM